MVILLVPMLAKLREHIQELMIYSTHWAWLLVSYSSKTKQIKNLKYKKNKKHTNTNINTNVYKFTLLTN